MRRQVIDRVRRAVAEDIMVEPAFPRGALGARKLADRVHREHQRGEGKAVLPLPEPIVDEDTDRAFAADMVPPHRWHVDGVAGCEFGDALVALGLGIERVAGVIGMVGVDHARRLTRDRALDGADVEVRYLRGREEGEAAAPRDDDRDIRRHVVVRRDAAGVADPDAGIDAGIDGQRVFDGEAGDAFGDRGRSRVEARRIRPIAQRDETFDERRHRHLFAAKIHPAHVVGVEIAPTGFGRADEHGERLAIVARGEIGGNGFVAFARRGDCGPVGRDAADDGRTIACRDRARDRGVVAARYLFQHCAHFASPALSGPVRPASSGSRACRRRSGCAVRLRRRPQRARHSASTRRLRPDIRSPCRGTCCSPRACRSRSARPAARRDRRRRSFRASAIARRRDRRNPASPP